MPELYPVSENYNNSTSKDETEADEEEYVQAIREWLLKQPHLAACPTESRYLLKYLRGCKYNIEKSKRKLDMTLTLRSVLPEFFSDWDPTSPENQEVLGNGGNLPLPGYDHLGRKVILIRMAVHNPKKIHPEAVHRASFMVWNVLCDEDDKMFTSGVVLIFDLEGFSFRHCISMPFGLAKKLTPCWEDANPIRPKSMNYIRTPVIFQAFYTIFSRLMNEKMKQRVKFHGNNYQSLYQEVNKEILPRDYGGDGPTLAELTDYWKKKLEDRREWLIAQEKMKSNECLRQGKPVTTTNMFGIQGSFRKLAID